MNAIETAVTARVFYPGLVTARFYDTWDFYTELLGFHTLSEDDNRVLLAHPSGARLEILRHETHEHFSELVSAADGRGFWLNLEIKDAEPEYQRMCAAGVNVVQPLEISARGQRVFAVRDPNGVLVCIASAPAVTGVEMPADGFPRLEDC